MKESEYIKGMRDILIPHCKDQSSRRALFYGAFFGCSRILDQIDYSGAAWPFVEGVARFLLEQEYNDQPAFVALLAALNGRIGENKWQEVVSFLQAATDGEIERGV